MSFEQDILNAAGMKLAAAEKRAFGEGWGDAILDSGAAETIDKYLRPAIEGSGLDISPEIGEMFYQQPDMEKIIADIADQKSDQLARQVADTQGQTDAWLSSLESNPAKLKGKGIDINRILGTMSGTSPEGELRRQLQKSTEDRARSDEISSIDDILRSTMEGTGNDIRQMASDAAQGAQDFSTRTREGIKNTLDEQAKKGPIWGRILDYLKTVPAGSKDRQYSSPKPVAER